MLKSTERSISSRFHGTVSLVSGNRRANRHKGYVAGKCSGCSAEAFLLDKGGKDFPYFAREDCIWHESGVEGRDPSDSDLRVPHIISKLSLFSSSLHNRTYISTTSTQMMRPFHLRKPNLSGRFEPATKSWRLLR
jgi:hypothetical protein